MKNKQILTIAAGVIAIIINVVLIIAVIISIVNVINNLKEKEKNSVIIANEPEIEYYQEDEVQDNTISNEQEDNDELLFSALIKKIDITQINPIIVVILCIFVIIVGIVIYLNIKKSKQIHKR